MDFFAPVVFSSLSPFPLPLPCTADQMSTEIIDPDFMLQRKSPNGDWSLQIWVVPGLTRETDPIPHYKVCCDLPELQLRWSIQCPVSNAWSRAEGICGATLQDLEKIYYFDEMDEQLVHLNEQHSISLPFCTIRATTIRKYLLFHLLLDLSLLVLGYLIRPVHHSLLQVPAPFHCCFIT